MQKDHVQILLASTPLTPVNEIEKQLAQTIGLECQLFQCRNLSSCLDHLHDKHSIDIILLDLDLVSVKDSKTFFQKIQQAASTVPIIIFTQGKKRKLALFLVSKGASIVRMSEKRKIAPNYLRDIIEDSWMRHKLSREEAEKNHASFETEHIRRIKNLRDEKENDTRLMKEKDQIIAWMHGNYSLEPSNKNSENKNSDSRS